MVAQGQQELPPMLTADAARLFTIDGTACRRDRGCESLFLEHRRLIRESLGITPPAAVDHRKLMTALSASSIDSGSRPKNGLLGGVAGLVCKSRHSPATLNHYRHSADLKTNRGMLSRAAMNPFQEYRREL